MNMAVYSKHVRGENRSRPGLSSGQHNVPLVSISLKARRLAIDPKFPWRQASGTPALPRSCDVVAGVASEALARTFNLIYLRSQLFQLHITSGIAPNLTDSDFGLTSLKDAVS